MKLICVFLRSIATLASVTTICSATVPYKAANAQDLYSQNLPSMNAQDFVERGRKLTGADQDNAEAIAAFTKAIELNPAYFEAYCYRGTAFGLSNQPLKAIEDIKKAADLLNARGEPDKAQVMLKFADDIREGIKEGDFDQ